MVFKRSLGLLSALALVASLPGVAEASFARATGSRYGGTLSSNRAIRTQQLTADPVTVLRGSTSTEYNPSVVSIANVTAEEGFFLGEVYVGVSFDNGETEDLVSLAQFLYGLEAEYQETGYLQVFYSRSEESYPQGQQFTGFQQDDGYVVVDTDGEIYGDNTHSMLFDFIAESDNTVASYRLYADDGSRGTSRDYLTSIDDPNTKIFDIQEANVSGALIPLPAAFGPGLLGLAGVVAHQLRKRRAA